jgi:hypothetical protein
MEWIEGFLEKHKRQQQFDDVWMSMPTFTGLTRPTKVSPEVIQWQGKEMRNLGRFLLEAVAVALRNPLGNEVYPFK